MSATLTFIVTHKEPAVPARFYNHIIALGDFNKSKALHVSDLDIFWHAMRPLAYSAAGTYTLPEALKRVGCKPTTIGIISQRKLILQKAIGILNTGGIEMREIIKEDLDIRSMVDSTPLPGADFLVPQPIVLPSGPIAQYAHVHLASDIFEFVKLAVDMDVLSRDDVKSFVQQKFFIPGGCEFGYFPSDWLIATLRKLEVLAREFLIKNDARLRCYDNYQVRALSLLSERIGSFLLIKELMHRYDGRIPREIFGHMSVIVDKQGYVAAQAI